MCFHDEIACSCLMISRVKKRITYKYDQLFSCYIMRKKCTIRCHEYDIMSTVQWINLNLPQSPLGSRFRAKDVGQSKKGRTTSGGPILSEGFFFLFFSLSLFFFGGGGLGGTKWM